VNTERHLVQTDAPVLTIAIPTYNRPDSLESLLSSLWSDCSELGVQVLVVDDGSPEATTEILQRFSSRQAGFFSQVRHESNGGYAMAFCSAFEACKTPYLMMVADDDVVRCDRLPVLLQMLRTEGADFASTQFVNDQGLYRGRTGKSRIKPFEFFAASAHAPGLVYRVQACLSFIGKIRSRADARCAASFAYPQVCLLMALMATGKTCLWSPIDPCAEGDAQPSGIRDSNGSAYWNVGPRWAQLKDFEAFAHELKAEVVDARALEELLQANRARVFGHMIQAMYDESPFLRMAFDRSAVRYYLKQWIKRILK
jgi:glycosyltransferase involved in cell wall biosynthesis